MQPSEGAGLSSGKDTGNTNAKAHTETVAQSAQSRPRRVNAGGRLKGILEEEKRVDSNSEVEGHEETAAW